MPSNISRETETEEVDSQKRRSKRIVANGSSTLYEDDVEDNDFTEEKLHSKRKTKSKSNGRDGGQSSIVSFFQKMTPDIETEAPEKKLNKEKKDSSNNKPKKKVKYQKKPKLSEDENHEVQGESVDNKKVRFSNELVEYSPEVVKRKVESCEENVDEKQVPVRNAFTFMMDSRNKVIGQNLSGKESEKDELSQDKTDLLVRKSFLQDWADTKGAKKRKLEYEETGLIIENKLKKRAKRLKKMLALEQKEDEDKSESFTKKRKLLVIQSDSDSNVDSEGDETSKPVATVRESETSVGVLTESANLNTITSEVKDSKKSKLTLKKKKQKISNDSEEIKQLSEDLDEKFNGNLSCATPNTVKKWKMRIRVPLSDEEEVSKSDEADTLLEDSRETVKSKIETKPKKNLGDYSDINKDCVPKKVASIFVKAKRMSAEAKEARKSFLRSGIPDALKKIFESERVEELEVQLFPTISHVMVKPTEEEINNCQINYWNLPSVDLNYSNFNFCVPDVSTLKFDSTTLSTLPDDTSSDLENYKISNIKSHLHKIKTENPNYPVYKVFNTFHQMHLNEGQKVTETQKEPEPPKQKRGRKKKVVKEVKKEETVVLPPKVNSTQMWTEFYKPSKSDDIFGNRSSVSYFKRWLQKWLESAEMEFDSKLKHRRNSDSSSDFEQDEREDSRRLLNNTLILSGPHGSGKTSLVYTICNELAINVLEVNASSKRTGKRLLNELQEATQSHQVRKAEKNALSSFLNKDSTKSSSQSSSSSSTSSQRMCVLLIEDVDVVFDQDENFISSLSELINTSKRPIVLTLTDKNCLHLKRLLSDHKIVTFKLFEPKILSTWLQVLCLTEGLAANNRALAELLENNRGDIRRTLLQLQFWVQTGGHSNIFRPFLKSTVTDSPEGSEVVADESSNMSWLNEAEVNVSKEDVTKECTAVSSNRSFLLAFPLDLGKIWWNLPGMLGLPSLLPKKKEDVGESKTELKKLEDIANVLDIMALADVWYTESNIDSDLEPVCGRKCSKTKDSLSLNESFLNYSSAKDFCYEASHMLLNSYTQIISNSDSVPRSSISDIKCWYQKQNRSMEPFYEITPPDYCLNRHAINVDYFSALRQIARSENIRSLGNIKRNNRFYHYLRNLGMSYNSSHLDVACKVLNCEEL